MISLILLNWDAIETYLEVIVENLHPKAVLLALVLDFCCENVLSMMTEIQINPPQLSLPVPSPRIWTGLCPVIDRVCSNFVVAIASR
jgi:hypothetical protein